MIDSNVFIKKSEQLNIPECIYFMLPTYGIGGGEVFFIRIIEYLLAYTDINVGVIDFKDGTLSRTCKKFFHDKNLHYVNYQDYLWNLKDNSLIFTVACHIGCIKTIEGKNVRIKVILWEAVIAWDLLFENKRKIYEVGKLLNKTKAICFTDIGCYLAGCNQLKQKFIEDYIPLFYYSPKYKIVQKQTSDSEINLVWLGRFAWAKFYSIQNIIRNFAKYRTNKVKRMHLIGNGPCEKIIKEFAKSYSDDIEFVFTGILLEDDLAEYLQKNTDVGFAMGTSILNFASLRLPVIMVPQVGYSFINNKFNWFFDSYKYCMGSSLGEDKNLSPMNEKLCKFDDMLDEICDNNRREKIANDCYQFYVNNFGNIQSFGKRFIESISMTTLTYKLLRKELKYLPYGDKDGLAVHKYKIFGFTYMKITTYNEKKKYYLFGIPFIKICNYNSITEKQLYILGFKVWEKSFWGKYDFPEITNNKLKKECSNKYSISELVIK